MAENEKKTVQTEYEVVQSSETFIPEIKVVPGQITSNLKMICPAIKARIEEISTLEPTEENLEIAKTEKAKINKVKDMLNAEWKNYKAEYNKPLEEAENLVKDCIKACTTGYETINNKVLAITDKQKEIKLNNAKELMANMIDATKNDKLIQLLTGCTGWIVKEEWGNKSYSDAKIKADVQKAIEEAEKALSVGKGAYEFEFYEEFKASGSIGSSLMKINELQKQAQAKAEYEAKMKAEKEQSEQAIQAESEIKADATKELQIKKCVASFKMRGTREDLTQYIALANQYNIELERLDK